VQQLFRQRIGKDLDQGIVDEVFFPILRSRKHPSKDLLRDIKLATDTLIITDYARREARHFSVQTFTPIPEYWTYVPAAAEAAKAYPPVGQRTSKVRRRNIRNLEWGAIDILNELRGLNYPQVGYKARSYVIEEPDSFDDAYISLAEDNSLPSSSRVQPGRARCMIDARSNFVNNFLDDVLITDKRLTWGASTPWGILSVVEASQYGEVQTQLH
jgi:hypothetical protein